MAERSEKQRDNLLLKTRQARSVSASLALMACMALLALAGINIGFRSEGHSLWYALVVEGLLFAGTWIWCMSSLTLLTTKSPERVLLSLNSANLVSSARLLSIPVVSQLLWITNPGSVIHQKALLLAALAAAFLSDLFDGMLARRRRQVTQFGAYLDPMADLFMALALSFVLSLKQLIPWWLFAIVALKVGTTIGAALIYMQKNLTASGIRSTLIGKTSVVAIILMMSMASLGAVWEWDGRSGVVLIAVFVACGALILLSILEKIVLFYKSKRRGWRSLEDLEGT